MGAIHDHDFYDARYEDAMFMLGTGETFERTAMRLGMTVKALEKFLAARKKKQVA